MIPKKSIHWQVKRTIRMFWHPSEAIGILIGYDDAIYIWNTPTKINHVDIFTGHETNGNYTPELSIQGVDFHPNGELVASSDSKNTLLIWNLMTREIVKQMEISANLKRSLRWRNNLSWNFSGDHIAYISDSGIVIHYNVLDSNSIRKVIPLDNCTLFKWNPTNDLIVAKTNSGKVKIIDPVIGVVSEIHVSDDFLYQIAWSPDGKLIALLQEYSLSVVHSDTTETLFSTICPLATDIAWNPNGRFLLASYYKTSSFLPLPFLWDLVSNSTQTYGTQSEKEEYVGDSPAWVNSEMFVLHHKGTLRYYNLDYTEFNLNPIDSLKRAIDENEMEATSPIQIKHLENAMNHLMIWNDFSPEELEDIQTRLSNLITNHEPEEELLRRMNKDDVDWFEIVQAIKMDEHLRASDKIRKSILERFEKSGGTEVFNLSHILGIKEWHQEPELINVLRKSAESGWYYDVERMEKYPDFFTIPEIQKSLAKGLECTECLYSYIALIFRHDSLMSSGSVLDSLESIVDKIAQEIVNPRDDCSEEAMFWDLIGVLREFNQIISHKTIQTAIDSKRNSLCEHMIGIHEYVLEDRANAISKILGIPFLANEFDIQLAILFFLEYYFQQLDKRKRDSLLEDIYRDKVLYEDRLILEKINRLKGDTASTDLTEEELHKIRDGITHTNFPYHVVQVLHKSPFFRNNEDLLNLLRNKFDDIADVIRTSSESLRIVSEIFDDPFFMKSKVIRDAIPEWSRSCTYSIEFIDEEQDKRYLMALAGDFSYLDKEKSLTRIDRPELD